MNVLTSSSNILYDDHKLTKRGGVGMAVGIDRIASIRDSLLESIFQVGWRRTGLYQMLNRALLAVQPSIVPVVFKKLDDSFAAHAKSHIDGATLLEIQVGPTDSYYCQVLNSFHDRRLGLRFAECIKAYTKTVELGTLGGDARSFEFLKKKALKRKSSPLLLRLFDTEFYVMFWEIDASGDDVALSARPITSASDVGQLFSKVFAPVNAAPAVIDIVSRALTANAKIIQHGTELHKRDNELVGGLDGEIKRILKVTALGERALRDVISGVYEKYSGSPLVSGFNSCPPNMMIFWKVFDRQSERCADYTYDVRCIVPLRQQIDIVNALSLRRKWLLDSLESLPDGNGEWQGLSKVDQYVRNIIKTAPELPVLPAHASRDVVDAWLKKFAESPYREIISAITGPQLRHERLFCETTLSSGIYNQRKRPFDRGRLMGLQKALGCSPEEDYRAHLRAVSFRYVMALMVPGDADLDNCSLIQIPVRVGGAPAACIVGVRRQDDVDKSIIDDDAFFYTYHYYHSISKHIIRDIRTQCRVIYGRLAGRLLELHMMSQIRHELSSDARRDVDSMLAKVNFDLAALGRIFPFEMLKLVRDDSLEPESLDASVPLETAPRSQFGNVVPLFRSRPGKGSVTSVDHSRVDMTRVEYEDNQVFDRMGDEVFIRTEMVAREMSHGALKATSSLEFAKLQRKWTEAASGK